MATGGLVHLGALADGFEPAPSVTAANLPKEADRAFAIVVIRADAALAGALSA